MTTYITEPAPQSASGQGATPAPWYKSKLLWTVIAALAAVGGLAIGGLTPVDLSAIASAVAALVGGA